MHGGVSSVGFISSVTPSSVLLRLNEAYYYALVLPVTLQAGGENLLILKTLFIINWVCCVTYQIGGFGLDLKEEAPKVCESGCLPYQEVDDFFSKIHEEKLQDQVFKSWRQRLEAEPVVDLCILVYRQS